MSEHAWVQENLDAYVTGAMSPPECSRVERHLSGCSDCAQARAEIGALEQLLQGVCTRVRPDVGLEDRAIQRLRRAPTPRPNRLRFVLAAAAVVVLGLIGGGVQMLVMDGTLPIPGMDAMVRVTNYKQTPSQIALASQEHEYRGMQNGVVKVKESGYGADAQENTFEAPRSLFTGPLTPGDGGFYAGVDFLYGKTNRQLPASEESKKRPTNTDGLADLDDKKESKDLSFYVDRVADKEVKHHLKLQIAPQGDAMKELLQLQKEPLSGKPYSLGRPSDLGGIAVGGGSGKGPGGYANGTLGTQPVPGPVFYNQPTTVTASEPMVASASTSPPAFYFPKPPPPVALPSQPQAKETPKSESAPKVEQGKPDKKPDQAAPPKEPGPTGRMIIRTGDMEFEIDSFDKAVDLINKLITSVKGGFIATVNSDKLANGKTKGSVIVRMPPQHLDKFIYDLRRELAKTSELKNQRLGSLDVTKQYTDIESRLRAARAIEERLINIIKTGKGEIKDLVAAEKELGIWRTKIEEMEGEIRYYANQVALSTLTITLIEKEILAPTAIVVTETVTIRIEVDEVAKAHQAAMKAIEDLKGRITRSELKQHTAGQFLSILAAEIPPAKKEAFIEQLKKLGIVSDFQENQRQHTEGGVGKAPELKPKASDVHFDITMHNTANIRPRLSADLKLATTDVPGAYAKLLAQIAKVKGQVRDGKLNEQDKHNITATLDFNVPTSEKPGIDKLLDEIGPMLERLNVQAPVSELSTDRKFGYTLLLRDFASIPPRQAQGQVVATLDVPASYAKLQEAVAKAKGQINDARLNEQDKFNVSAQLDFTVPAEEKGTIEKLLTDLGTMLSRNNLQAPANQVATPKKFGFSTVLRDFANILPSHASDIKVAASDVPGNYARLVDAVVKAKGQIRVAKLNEQDKLNISATLDFTVPIGDKTGIDKLLADIGTMLSRNNVQAPVNELTTDRKFGYTVLLRDIATIPPRESFHVALAAVDVPIAYHELKEMVAAAKGMVTVGQLVEDTKVRIEAKFDFDVPAADRQKIESLFSKVGAVLARTNSQVPVNVLATDQKVGYQLILRSAAAIPPREVITVKQEVKNMDTRVAELNELIVAGKGRVVDSNVEGQENGQAVAVLKYEVPFASRDAILKQIKGERGFVSQKAVRNSQVPENDLTTAHIIVTLAVNPFVTNDETLGSYVRTSFQMSFRVFSMCVMLIILGLSAVLPWVLVVWFAYRVYCKMVGVRGVAVAAPSGSATPSGEEAAG